MEVRKAGASDYKSMVELTDAERWNYKVEDFRRLDESGNSNSLVAEEGGKIIGMITLMDYGSIGWISNVIVAEHRRGFGIGRGLLREGLKVLSNKKTVELFAYEDTVEFYLKEGFKLDRDFYYVRFTEHPGGEAVPGRAKDIFMDKECFGYSRPGILNMLADGGELLSPVRGRGFAIVRNGSVDPTVGPVVADEMDAGMGLLYAAFNRLGRGCYAVLKSPDTDGVEVVERISRVYIGEPHLMKDEKIFAFAGLEFG